MQFIPAQLNLQSGEIFQGFAPVWQTASACGEVVFNTGMVGYEQALTDPSYAGQILSFTYPLIGNYGVGAPDTWESSGIHAKGVIVSEAAPFYSHYAAQSSFIEWLQAQQIPLLCGIDTRALTKVLRQQGVAWGVISTQAIGNIDEQACKHLVKAVTVKQAQVYGSGEKTIIAVDCGMKANILRCLQGFPWRIKRVPFDYDYTHEPFDGVFISNGPGDPMDCTDTIAILQKALSFKKPIFGICLGAQLLGLAVKAQTYKLKFGHRGQNQPCLYLPNGRCYLTSQNHGYAIVEDSLPADWQVTFRHLNDQTIAGIAHRELPFSAVQFHPEAAPGPMDTEWLFTDFHRLVRDGDYAK